MRKITKNKYFIPLIIAGIIMIAIFGKYLAINWYEPEITRYESMSVSGDYNTLTYSEGVANFRNVHTYEGGSGSEKGKTLPEWFKPSSMGSSADVGKVLNQPAAKFILKQAGINPSQFDYTNAADGRFGFWLNDLSTQTSSETGIQHEDLLREKFPHLEYQDKILRNMGLTTSLCYTKRTGRDPGGESEIYRCYSNNFNSGAIENLAKKVSCKVSGNIEKGYNEEDAFYGGRLERGEEIIINYPYEFIGEVVVRGVSALGYNPTLGCRITKNDTDKIWERIAKIRQEDPSLRQPNFIVFNGRVEFYPKPIIAEPEVTPLPGRVPESPKETTTPKQEITDIAEVSGKEKIYIIIASIVIVLLVFFYFKRRK